MKEYSFHLDGWLIEKFFSPIRNKGDVIVLLMNSIKHMLVNPPVEAGQRVGGMTLVVSKTSRLFYFTNNKYFSVAFPFSVFEVDGRLEFTSKTVRHVDNKVTSDVLSVLSNGELFENECAIEFVEPILDIANNEALFWPFLLGLFMYEDGYIRYDHDKANENGSLHPLHHYDCCYSTFSAYKIGLRRDINLETMIDFLQLSTNCHFLEHGAA